METGSFIGEEGRKLSVTSWCGSKADSEMETDSFDKEDRSTYCWVDSDDVRA